MNALRIGNNKKSKGNKAISTAPLGALDVDVDKDNLPQGDILSDPLPLKDRRRLQDSHPISTSTPTPLQADTKPLPTLPDAAYPVTVAYPVRCSLDQLYRYFLEMTSLALEIQITPNLILLASVPNLADLFRNIHGTFSGVFTFTKVLQNDNPQLAGHKVFGRKAVLGMVVFQAWCQDTSDIGDTSEGSESASNVSIDLEYNINNDQRTTHHQPQHTHDLVRLQPRLSHHNFGHPTKHPSTSYHHHPPPNRQQQQSYQLRSSPGISPKQQLPVHPLSLNTTDDLALSQQQQHRPGLSSYREQHQRSHIDRQPPVGSRHHDLHGHQTLLRFDDEPSAFRHRRFPSHLHAHTSGPSGVPDEDQYRGPRVGGRQHDITAAAGVGSIDSLRQYPSIKLPVSDVNPRRDTIYRKPAKNTPQRQSQDDLPYQHRRSEDTNITTNYSQSSRSRPRSGATAAAIGRLDTVLARGEDLLQGKVPS
ncbi:hypothetical protein EC991_008060 [Linnemannia zychae]|nr:hypothetical protein EC991_008060 [Linnemannia zychae]